MKYQYSLKVVDTAEVLNEISTRMMWFDGKGQIIQVADGIVLNFDGDKDGMVRFLQNKHPNAIITDFQ